MVSDKISHKNLDSKKSTYYGDMFYFILNNKKIVTSSLWGFIKGKKD